MNSTKRGQIPIRKHLIQVVVVLAVLMLAGLSQAAQFKTKEEVLAHLIANSPWRGSWVRYGRATRGHNNGGMTAIFTKEGGNLSFTHTRRPLDGEINDLDLLLEDDKVTLTFRNSNPTSGARYNLELKDDKLVGISKDNFGESDIELAPNPTK